MTSAILYLQQSVFPIQTMTNCVQDRPNKWIVFVYMETEQHSWMALTNQAQRGQMPPQRKNCCPQRMADGKLCTTMWVKLPQRGANKTSDPIAAVLCFSTLHNPVPSVAVSDTSLVANQLVLVKEANHSPLILIPLNGRRLVERQRWIAKKRREK